jgi:hypothetical protein
MRSGRPSGKASPWHTSPCQRAPGWEDSQRSRAVCPGERRADTLSSPACASSLRTVLALTAPWRKRPWATRVRTMRVAEALGCSRRMSSSNWRVGSSSACPRPVFLRGRDSKAARPPRFQR